LEREVQRNVELMWLTGRLALDFKTIADFRKVNGEAIRLVCREFVMLCRKLNLLTYVLVVITATFTLNMRRVLVQSRGRSWFPRRYGYPTRRNSLVPRTPALEDALALHRRIVLFPGNQFFFFAPSLANTSCYYRGC